MENHFNKCRCCFETFEMNQKRVKITKTIELKFCSLTQIKLISSKLYSNFICNKCKDNLCKFHVLKIEFAEKQAKLYEAVKVEKQVKLLNVTACIDPIKSKMIEIHDEYQNGTEIEHLPLTIESQSKEEKMIQRKKKTSSGICPECGKIIRDVKSHLKVVHFKLKQFSCDLCTYTTNIFKNMRRHQLRHLSSDLKKTHQCHVCLKVVNGSRSLESHIKYCHEVHNKDFLCFCGKRYKRKTELQQHTRIFHEKKYNYFCNRCEKAFSNATYFKEHMLAHANEGRKEFSCEKCGKLYAFESLMKKHLRTHDEPNVRCEDPLCFKMFHFQANARKHYRQTHLHETRPCEHCGKGISLPTYQRHIKELHLGLEKVKCGILGCGSLFLRRDNYRYHVKKTHADYFNRLSENAKSSTLNRIEFQI